MKLKYILSFFTLFSIVSCGDKEDALVPTDASVGNKFEFPQGTPFDDITTEINDTHGVQIIWKGVNNNFINQTTIGSKKWCSLLDEEQAGRCIDFVKKHVFDKVNPALTRKAMKPYLYLVYDLHQSNANATGYAPTKYDYDGNDYWTFCFMGRGVEFYPGGYSAIVFPEKEADVILQRSLILAQFYKKLITKEVIKAPSFIKKDLILNKAVKTSANEVANPDYFMNRGFVGKYSEGTSVFSAGPDSKTMNEKDVFLAYIMFVSKYNLEDLEKGTVKLGTIAYNRFPIIIEYYKIIDKYMMDTYDCDLKLLQKL